MNADKWQTARDWAKLAISSRKFYGKLKENYETLALASIEPGGLDSMTSGAKNAVSMGKQVGLSIPDTLAAMTRALEWADQGCIPSRTTSFGRF